ncbi:MAG: UDP-N-acetylmuramate dehydrogenase [Candidatus Saccharibacteria bacterium]|nr:UDP-N-acetylmuramate dehydrogenase [Candidatus Saccharibacteria bacterium]
MKIRENVLLSNLTTMRLGGPARYVIEIEEPNEIKNAHLFAKEKGLPIFILGGGANSLGHDAGYQGVIIKNKILGITSSPATKASPHNSHERMADTDETLITAMGGETWDDVVAYACDLNLTGIEALSKIPGLAGAAPVQNIGAYGQDVSETFVSAYAYDLKTDAFVTLKKSDFNFSYRKSILNTSEKNRYFIVSITLKLNTGEMSHPFYGSIEKYLLEHNITDYSPSSIREIVSTIRAEKLPDPEEKASAGSFFKNVYLSEKEAKIAEEKGLPVYHGKDGLKINSGWLIEKSGLKGSLIHGIRVSDKVALVLINESAKSYADLAAARAEIIETVKAKFGFTLEQEPNEIL